MGYVTEKDYVKMAEAAADDLMQNQVPLNDSIKKFAKLSSLNHEQVHRLCEATNNAAFNKLFQGRDKTAEDRIIEFDVASPKEVLGDSIKEAQAIVAEYDEPDESFLLSDFRSLREPEQVVRAKVAFDEIEAPPPMTPREKEAAARTVRKTYDYMKHEKIAQAQLYDDALYNMKARFSRLYQDTSFEDFEKQAVALHGASAVRPLADLRRTMKLPEVTYNIGILQKRAGFVDDSSVEFKLLSEAIASSEKMAQYDLGLEKLQGLLR